MGMIKLYKVENERGHFSMWGDIQNGRLSLSGSDYGKAVSGFWGGGGFKEFCEENGIDPGFGSYIDFDD